MNGATTTLTRTAGLKCHLSPRPLRHSIDDSLVKLRSHLRLRLCEAHPEPIEHVEDRHVEALNVRHVNRQHSRRSCAYSISEERID